MIVNKLNQIYKPKRTLYYIDSTEEDIHAYYRGIVPEELKPYTKAFGTYDYPGVFFISSLKKEVIGIEFRQDDPRVTYPENLNTLTLEGAFYYSVEIDEEVEITTEFIAGMFKKIAEDDDAHRVFSDLSIKANPKTASVFIDNKKLRILHECTLDTDRTTKIIKDDASKFDKRYLYHMAFFDSITSHYNWNHLRAFLEVPRATGIDDYAFAHFDIKGFSVINEVYGHIAANKILNRIARAMEKADFVYSSARCHNDNFAMMIKDMPKPELTKRLYDFFESLSYLEEAPNYKIYYRCGVVPMHRSILSGNRVADAGKIAQALGTDKSKTEIIFYTDKMHEDLTWGSYIKAYLETAVKNDEFEVYLQPKFDISTEKIKGSEALIRWNYKRKELLSPAKFIPFFEKDGSIGIIDDIVLKKVCMSLSKWKREGKPLYPVSVNLSRKRLYDKNLINHLVETVDSYGVSHELIDFELTESATYDNMNHMISVLEEIRSKGFKISMDDFGTGYSSLSLLTQMPLDTLKIDKSFVDKVCTGSERDFIVIKHIITLAKELGFACLAEGAEFKNQVERLHSLGCEAIQGFYYSKPIPIEEYEKLYL